jgi:LCP family protein required for cell wall assembly
VKRQFISPQSGKGYQPEQIPLSSERSSAAAGSVITSEQPQRGSPPPTFIPHRPITNGAVSNWNVNELTSLPFVWNPAPVSLADQETIEQAAIQQPNGNGYPQGNLAWGAGNEFGQVSSPWSGQFSPSMPPVPKQGQGGGLPPFIQPPSGEGWNRKPKKKRRVPIWAKVVLFSLLFLIVGVGGYVGYYWFFLLSPHVGHIVDQPVARLKGDEDPNVTRNGSDILSGGRINILLLGSDTDQKFNGNYIAQTDIVITVDPTTKSVGMLSIPRDFYINVPGSGLHKLDEAYGLGGVALSRLTIYQDFGIPINYYAWVGLDGFVKVIDTVGGVDVDVIHPITDDNYPDDVGNNNTGDIYALKRLYLTPGPQHLSGQTALEYVRSRHADMVGDFGRSARQQEVLGQLKNKLNNPGIIGKLPAIANDLDGYVKTDMQLGDVFKLLNFARALDQSKISRAILGPPYSALGMVGTESVVFPNCEKIVPVIAQMFALGGNAKCDIQANTGTIPRGSSSLASASTSQSTYPLNTAVRTLPGDASNVRFIVPQVVTTSATSLNGNVGDLFGFHSLLDLLFLAVFDSPSALQI